MLEHSPGRLSTDCASELAKALLIRHLIANNPAVTQQPFPDESEPFEKTRRGHIARVDIGLNSAQVYLPRYFGESLGKKSYTWFMTATETYAA